MGDTAFRMKNYENINEPKWPKIIHLLSETGLKNLNLGKC